LLRQWPERQVLSCFCFTLPMYRDTVLNALTTFMITGEYYENKKPFLEQMAHIAYIRVIRSHLLDKQYTPGKNTEYALSEAEEAVISLGKPRILETDNFIEGIFPYVARSMQMGKNCLSCHNVKDGEVLGAVSIRIPLKDSFARIWGLQKLYIGLGLAGIIMSIIIVFLVFRALSTVSRYIGRVELIASSMTISLVLTPVTIVVMIIPAIRIMRMGISVFHRIDRSRILFNRHSPPMR
ncbi:hypothetical protein ACFLZI_03115, partial [Nitrospirota bacterium]